MSKEILEELFYSALDVVKAKRIITDNITLKKNILTVVDQKIDLNTINDLYIFGVGKAAYEMAKTCEGLLKDKIKDGVIISTQEGKLQYLKHLTSTHPIVSNKSLKAADELSQMMEQVKEDDYFIFLLSGGASAMIEKPIEGLRLEDFTKISSALLVSGLDIKALNTTRKALSQIKGGKLANTIKAKGDVLVLSDVIGDDLDTIGSAPMNNGLFKHHLIGNNTLALKAAKKAIKNRVEKTKILTTTLDLPSKEAAKEISQQIKKYSKKYKSFCLLIGGETTTTVKKTGGYGGRNQELALRLLLQNAPDKELSILCAGSDGIDGHSKANGAFVDHKIYEKIEQLNLDPKAYLKNSNSNTFFKKLGYEFTTGITGTNVMDFIIILKDNNNG